MFAMSIVTKFTTDDIGDDDAVILEYRDARDGDPDSKPVLLRSVLIKGGAALEHEPGVLHELLQRNNCMEVRTGST